MKLKKVLSLALAISSLATLSGFVTSKAVCRDVFKDQDFVRENLDDTLDDIIGEGQGTDESQDTDESQNTDESQDTDESQNIFFENNELQEQEQERIRQSRAMFEAESKVVARIKGHRRTRKLYNLVISKKSLAPMKRGGTLGANISYIENMVNNINDHIDFIALYCGVPESRVNEVHKMRFRSACNEILNYANEFTAIIRNEDKGNVLNRINLIQISPLNFDESDDE